MTAEEQLIALRAVYEKTVGALYRKDKLLKITIGSRSDKEWFDKQLALAEKLCSLFELSIMNRNARRAMGYLCALSMTVRQIDSKTGGVKAPPRNA